LPPGGGLLTPLSSGGCVASSRRSLAVYDRHGNLAWETQTATAAVGGEIVITPGGDLVRIEGGSVVTRRLDTGEAVGAFAAARSSGLCLAPWGDLLYSHATPGDLAAVRCVDTLGGERWSVVLDRPEPLAHRPVGLGDLVVFAHRGSLWSFDRDGRSPWLVDHHGLRTPDEQDGSGQAVSLVGPLARIDATRAIVRLTVPSGILSYLLDVAKPDLTPVAPVPLTGAPFVVLRNTATPYGVVGVGPQVRSERMEWSYPVEAFGADGRRLWSSSFPVRPNALATTTGGAVVVAATPSRKRWDDYHQWYDMSEESFVVQLDRAGGLRWAWHPSGVLTHFPVVGRDDTVLVGAEGRLWAFAAEDE
jgi:outer membrane protein assembly factor BamB